MKKKLVAVLCAAALMQTFCVNAEYEESDLKSTIYNAVSWKEENDSPFYSAGSADSDFYIMALKRLGKNYDYTSYLTALDGIAAGYGTEHDCADMSRTVLAVAASGGDAENVGGRDLVAAATYHRNADAAMDKDGVDGYSWALIALDANGYETPDWAALNRDGIIAGLLSHQNTDGSFDGSVYSTASAIIALAPYREGSGAYTITQNQTGSTFDISPNDAVNKALDYLSAEQKREGDWGDLKSTAMTIIALDTVGIDADGDSRFTSGKGTALEGMMLYQNRDGGFTEQSGRSDGEATSLALCAVISHLRKMQGKSNFFAFRENDYIDVETSAPAETEENTDSNTSSTSKDSSKSTPKPSVTTRPAASGKTSSTTKPSSTKKPSATMRPTKTTTPMDQASPNPESSPKATKRPALVGPPEMPGPIETQHPQKNVKSDNEQATKTSNSTIIAIVCISTGVLLALLAAAAFIFIKYFLPNKKNDTAERHKKYSRQGIERTKLKNVPRRKTAEHRHYEERERYRRREKYRR